MSDESDPRQPPPGIVSDSTTMRHHSAGRLPEGSGRNALGDSIRLQQQSADAHAASGRHRLRRHTRLPSLTFTIAVLWSLVALLGLVLILAATAR